MLLSNIAYAQQPIEDCKDIKVTVTTIEPQNGGSNGQIELTFTEPTSNYKIFWLNEGPDKTGKVEVQNGKIEKLKTGFFDFLIIDKNRKGCIRQLTVILK